MSSSFAAFEPSGAIQRFRNIPRFGHSNNVAQLISINPSNYWGGIIAFCIFISCIFFIWTCIILVLKFYYGPEKVGWAAGGNIVDIKRLKRHYHLSKLERKNRILRNWRVQTACLLTCVVIVPVSVAMLRLGLAPFLTALDDIEDISDEIDTRAYRGIELVSALLSAKNNLDGFTHTITFQRQIDLKWICPSLGTNNNNDGTAILGTGDDIRTATLELLNLPASSIDVPLNQTVTEGLHELTSFVETYQISDAVDLLYQATNASASLDSSIVKLHENDWILRFIIMVLNIVVFFFIIGILLTKSSIDYPAYQRLAAWFTIPIFVVLLGSILVASFFFVTFGIVNSDFCAGGLSESPFGTLQAVLSQAGFSTRSLPYETLDYYATDCLSENPLAFMEDIHTEVGSAHDVVNRIYESINSNNLPDIAASCGSNNHLLDANETLHVLAENIRIIDGSLSAAIDLVGCSSISPVFRRLFYGSSCTTSVEGLSVIFSCLLTICFLGFIVLTLRAALFNPVIRGRRRKLREKEFHDYKEFMSRFYDVSEWNLDFIPCVGIDETSIEQQLDSPASYHSHTSDDTTSTDDDRVDDSSSLAPQLTGLVSPELSKAGDSRYTGNDDDDEDDADESHAPIPLPANYAQMDSDDSSYDSTYSIENDSDMASVGSMSALSRIFLLRTAQSQTPSGGDDLNQSNEARSELQSGDDSILTHQTFMSKTMGSFKGGVGSLLNTHHPSDTSVSGAASVTGSVASARSFLSNMFDRASTAATGKFRSRKNEADNRHNHPHLPIAHGMDNIIDAPVSPADTSFFSQATKQAIEADPLALGGHGMWEDPYNVEMEPLSPPPPILEKKSNDRDDLKSSSRRLRFGKSKSSDDDIQHSL